MAKIVIYLCSLELDLDGDGPDEVEQVLRAIPVGIGVRIAVGGALPAARCR